MGVKFFFSLEDWRVTVKGGGRFALIIFSDVDSPRNKKAIITGTKLEWEVCEGGPDRCIIRYRLLYFA